MKVFTTVLIAITLITQTICGFYEDDPHVKAFANPDEFIASVIGTPRVWVVEFYAPWCPHCQSFTPEFQKAAENLKNIISFGSVDCNEESLKPLCGHFQVKGLPTILLFPSDLEQVTEGGKSGFTKKPITFEGQRKAPPLATWALGLLPDRVSSLTSNNMQQFFGLSNRAELAKIEHFALYFTNKEKTPNLIKALQLDFAITPHSKKWIPIGKVQDTENGLVGKYEVTSFPCLIITSKNGEKIKQFDKEFNYQNMLEFLNEYAYLPKEEDFAQKGKPASATPSPPKNNELHHVTNQEEYDKACSKFGLCFIAILDKEDPENDKYIELLTTLVGKYKTLNTIWINGPDHKDFVSKLPVADGYPQAVILHRRKKKVRVMKNAWDLDLVSEFVDNTLAAKGRTMGIDEDPTFGEILTQGESKEDL